MPKDRIDFDDVEDAMRRRQTDDGRIYDLHLMMRTTRALIAAADCMTGHTHEFALALKNVREVFGEPE